MSSGPALTYFTAPGRTLGPGWATCARGGAEPSAPPLAAVLDPRLSSLSLKRHRDFLKLYQLGCPDQKQKTFHPVGTADADTSKKIMQEAGKEAPAYPASSVTGPLPSAAPSCFLFPVSKGTCPQGAAGELQDFSREQAACC